MACISATYSKDSACKEPKNALSDHVSKAFSTGFGPHRPGGDSLLLITNSSFIDDRYAADGMLRKHLVEDFT